MKKLILPLILLAILVSFGSCRSRKALETSTTTSKIDTVYIPDSTKYVLPGDTTILFDSIPCPQKINQSGTYKTKAKKGKPSTQLNYKIVDNKLEIESIRDQHEEWVKYYKQHIKESVKETILKKEKKGFMYYFQNSLLLTFAILVMILLIVIFLRR